MSVSIQCGTIKAQFSLNQGKELWGYPSYNWSTSITTPRVTDNYIYIMLGHKAIRDNAHAKELIIKIESLRGHITRLDFCADYLGTFAFDAYYELMDTGSKPIPSMLKNPSGKTVYIGKRSSPRMLRIYNKRAEILQRSKVDIGFELTRIELEVKRNMIQRYKELFLSDRLEVILNDIQHLYNLRIWCSTHELSKPIDIQEKSDNVFAFIERYKNIIGTAYSIDRPLFLDIIRSE